MLRSAGIAILALVLIDVGVFRSGLYDQLVELDSSIGKAVQAVHSRCQDEADLVAVVGDSRITEGFAERVFDAMMRQQGMPLRGINLGMPGSSLRVWSLLLERVDPRRDRFRHVVVPLGQYVGSELERQDPSSRLKDLSFMGPISGIWRSAELSASFPSASGQQAAWFGSVFKSFAYRRDLRALFADPMSRTSGRWRLMHGHPSSHGYLGRPEDMSGLRVEGQRIVGYPAAIPKARRRALSGFVFGRPDPEQVELRRRYRAQWLGRICARYAGTATRVVIVRLPPTVLPAADSLSQELGPVLQLLQEQPHVFVVPVVRTASLQAPAFFCDTTHLNKLGRGLWTRRLAEFIGAMEN